VGEVWIFSGPTQFVLEINNKSCLQTVTILNTA